MSELFETYVELAELGICPCCHRRTGHVVVISVEPMGTTPRRAPSMTGNGTERCLQADVTVDDGRVE